MKIVKMTGILLMLCSTVLLAESTTKQKSTLIILLEGFPEQHVNKEQCENLKAHVIETLKHRYRVFEVLSRCLPIFRSKGEDYAIALQHASDELKEVYTFRSYPRESQMYYIDIKTKSYNIQEKFAFLRPDVNEIVYEDRFRMVEEEFETLESRNIKDLNDCKSNAHEINLKQNQNLINMAFCSSDKEKTTFWADFDSPL